MSPNCATEQAPTGTRKSCVRELSAWLPRSASPVRDAALSRCIRRWRCGFGAGNVATSLIFAAGKAGFELRIAAPKAFQPSTDLVKRAGGKIVLTEDVRAAAAGADLLYTDVWVSMGREKESADRIRQLSGYQVNAAVVAVARPGALVMHCLPAYRGKEIDEVTFEANAQTIFDEAENRLHVQKAILSWLVS